MLEVCAEDLRHARIAADAGADRVELCRELRHGGLTPSPDAVRQVRAGVSVPLIALIRCRIGDFVYSQAEQAAMLDDARRALDLGADGVAVGGCAADHGLEWAFMERMAAVVRAAGDRAQLVVHRVFDRVSDKGTAALRLAELGFDRVLTSGGAERAADSLPALAALQAGHGHRIDVLPAGGISAANARHVLASTGCRQLHGSFRDRGAAATDAGPCPHEIAAVKRILMETLSP